MTGDVSGNEFLFGSLDELQASLALTEEDSERAPEPVEKTPYERAISLANSVLKHPLDDNQATALAAVYAQLAIADALNRVETGRGE